MTTTYSASSLLENLRQINHATDELVAKVHANLEYRDVVVGWLKADLELLEQMREELRQNAPADCNADDECQDPILSALTAAIATKCLAVSALTEASVAGATTAMTQ